MKIPTKSDISKILNDNSEGITLIFKNPVYMKTKIGFYTFIVIFVSESDKGFNYRY